MPGDGGAGVVRVAEVLLGIGGTEVVRVAVGLGGVLLRTGGLGEHWLWGLR